MSYKRRRRNRSAPEKVIDGVEDAVVGTVKLPFKIVGRLAKSIYDKV